jgi:trimethylguanosine synthase
MISPIPGDELFELTRQITNNVAFFLPRNVDIGEVGALVAPTQAKRTGLAGTVSEAGENPAIKDGRASDKEQEMVEVEEAWMGNKLKAVTCYFGGLAVGQQHLF